MQTLMSGLFNDGRDWDICHLTGPLPDGLTRETLMDGLQQAVREDHPCDWLANTYGLRPKAAARCSVVVRLARRLTEPMALKPRLRTPADVYNFMRMRVESNTEGFWVLPLSAKNTLIGQPINVTRGIADASLVHPREVFRTLILRNAIAGVLVHNHPSGDPTPSAEDVRITRQLVETGKVVNIAVMDHVVIGARTEYAEHAWVSLRESGLVSFV